MSFGNMRRSPQQNSDDFAVCVNLFVAMLVGGLVIALIVALLNTLVSA